MTDRELRHAICLDAIGGLVVHFHALIRQVTRPISGIAAWLPGHLPDAEAIAASTAQEPGFLSVPGMYGGFSYHLTEGPGGLELHVESWCRVIDGSEQAYVVSEKGWRQLPAAANDDGGLYIRSPKEMGVPHVSVLCWNVNNRIGHTRFRPEAARAAMETGADVLVFNEFYPATALSSFKMELHEGGWTHQTLSETAASLKANGVLLASRLAHRVVELPPSTVDGHLSSNALCIDFDDFRMFALRVPTYTGAMRAKAWDWVTDVAGSIQDSGRPAVLCGDLNTSIAATGARRVPQFHALLEAGYWRRVRPEGKGSYFGQGHEPSEIDHVLASARCVVSDARYVMDTTTHCLVGSPGALSDHAALLFEVTSIEQVIKTVRGEAQGKAATTGQ